MPRLMFGMLGLVALAAAPVARAPAGPGLTIALAGSLSGPDAVAGARIRDGAVLAIEQANQAGGIGGMPVLTRDYDDGAANADGYDAAAAATAARSMTESGDVVAVIGPTRSGAARAMLPILNEAGLAMLSPAASAPDLTSVRFAAENRPRGRLTFFRLVASDRAEGPALARYWARALHVGSVFVLDDQSRYGVDAARGFLGEAARDGMRVLGQAELAPGQPEPTALMARIAALKPGGIYYGGGYAAGVGVIRAAYAAMPSVVKGAGEGLYGPEILTEDGFPAAQGWFITLDAPHAGSDGPADAFAAAYTRRFGVVPDGFAMAAYDAATIVLSAMRAEAGAGRKPTREAIRAAIAAGQIDTAQGRIGFDPNGDLRDPIVSIYAVRQNPAAAADAMDAQFQYVGPGSGG